MTDERGVISRRAMLALLGGAAVVVAGGVVVREVTDDGGGSGAGADQDTVARIGRRYLELVPSEASKAKLRAQLPAVSGSDLESLGALKQASAEDFAAARWVAIDGWLLSLTEARAAALLSLS